MSENNKKSSKLASSLFEFVEVIVQAIIIILIIFVFFFRVSGVVGNSMNPTLENGNWVLLSNMKYNYTSGDIVVVTQPWQENEPIIKRVIATEGQTVDIDFSTGEVKVDGELLEENYIKEPTYTHFDVTFPHTVPKGHVFCMGDNRNDSWDSRSSAIGDIDVRYIIGEAIYKIYPFGKIGA